MIVMRAERSIPAVPARSSSSRQPRVSRGRGTGPADLAWLEAHSHRPEVQRLIRDAIRRGRIQVRAIPGAPDRVKILPTATHAPSDATL